MRQRPAILLAREKTMNAAKVRTFHRRLGISIAFFLLIQAVAGMLMSLGRLASLDMSQPYNFLYTLHAGWNPWGSIYRVVLGLATAMQGIWGIKIFLNRRRTNIGEKTVSTIPSSQSPSSEAKKEVPKGSLSFAADIRPLFRDKDITAMKPHGIDLSSHEDVKRSAQGIYARLRAEEMPCDEPWSDDLLRKFDDWIQSGMEP
jgi:succinate dehydrogenase/fumarate reductase cytochrome b subunit